MKHFICFLILIFLLVGIGGGCRRSGEADVPSKDTGIATAKKSPEPGEFRGRVILKGPRPDRQKINIVKDVAVCEKINHLDDRLVVGGEGGIMNAVVEVRGVHRGRGIETMGTEFILDQRSCAYSPHVLLIPVGVKARILNDDGILHNIHTFSTLNTPFNVAQPKVLREVQKSFTVPERISVKCDVHGWMSSWVVVVDHPYYAVTDEEGNFRIPGIPPGRYTVNCWQEELGEVTTVIKVGETPDGAYHVFYYDGGTTGG